MKIATIKREPEDMVYTVEEVATIMRASKQYVYTLINANQIRIICMKILWITMCLNRHYSSFLKIISI